jgi:hypothetical protein
MALSNSDGEDALHEHVRALQKEIGISEYFLQNLFKESDDWSFVVKLNALVEAALTHLLTETIGRPELKDVLAHTSRAGKTAFATALGLLEPEDRRLIVKLAEMRNVFVHDVKRVNLTIPEYLKSLSEGDRKGFLKAIRYYAGDEQTLDLPGVGKVDVAEFVEENPKLAIWFSAMNLIGVLYVHKESSALSRQFAAMRAINDAFASVMGKGIGGPSRDDKT